MKGEKTGVSARAVNLISILLCILLLPVLLINVTLIVKSYVSPDKVPSIAGYSPLIVLTDSMYPQIESGDLIICRTIPPEEVKEGDVISFFDPEGNGESVVTHRVVEVTDGEEGLSFRTRGDANNADDSLPVPAENVVGIYQNRFRGMGDAAMFLQTTPGILICVGIPLLILLAVDTILRKLRGKKERQDTDALRAELEALRAEKAKAEND